MKLKTLLAGAAVMIAVLTLSSCEWFPGYGLSDLQRAQAFVATANEDPRDPVAMRAHFHPNTGDYANLNTSEYWELTFFGPDDSPFALSGLKEGGEVGGIAGTTSLVGTISSANAAPTTITFGFLADQYNARNRLIRYIDIQELGEEIRSIR